MEMPPRRVMMLELDNGKCPLEEWLRGFRDKSTRARITRGIDKLERGDIGARRGVGESVAELKLDFGPGYRVYYAQIGSAVVVLLGGSDKSDQARAIDNARELWRQFEAKGLPVGSLKSWSQTDTESSAS